MKIAISNIDLNQANTYSEGMTGTFSSTRSLKLV